MTYQPSQSEDGTTKPVAGSGPIQPAVGGMTDAELVGAIARGWCHSMNAHKEMDPALAIAIATEVRALLASTSPAQTGESAPEKSWNDRDDEWTEQIDAAHPLRSKNYKAYDTAMQMVGNRHGKHALVELVCWLLQRQTGGVDQAWVEAVRKARDRLIATHDGEPATVGVIEDLAALLGAGNANSDSVHLTTVSDKAPTARTTQQPSQE